MSRTKCGGHCPIENLNDTTSVHCSVCGNVCHLPCYDVIVPKAKIFVIRNIGFTCDDCMTVSPKRKGTAATQLKQSTLTPNVGISSVTTTPASTKSGKSSTGASKGTNEQLHAMLKSMKKTIDQQSNKLDELGQNIVGTRNDIVKVQKTQGDIFSFVTSGSVVPPVVAHERFRPRSAQNPADMLQTPNRNATVNNDTLNGNDNLFGGKRRTYSTVVQTKLPVTPFSGTSRTKVKTISLINNETGQTVKSVKFPSPKQGKKDVQIGRQIEEQQRPTRIVNPMTKAIFVSPFHPDTKIDEVSKYIVEHTDAKDDTKFKCTKLVKKDADLTQMKSVSFKIDVTPEVYDILIDPENWPKNKRIREFIKMSPPKITLKDYINPNNGKVAPSTSNAISQQNAEKNETLIDLTNNDSGTSGSNSNNSTDNNESATSTPSKND